jgi:hypothetical protein
LEQIIDYISQATGSRFDLTNLDPLVSGGSLVFCISIFLGTSISLNTKVAKDGAIARLCWVVVILETIFCVVAGVTAAELFLVFLPILVSTSLILGSRLGTKDALPCRSSSLAAFGNLPQKSLSA